MSVDPRSPRVGRYTFFFADLQSNSIIDALPLRSVAFELLLNKAGQWSGRLALGDPRLVDVNRAVLATNPKQTCLYIDLNGVLQYGGVVWARDYDPTTRELILSGADFWSLMKGQRIVTTQTFAATDQLTIFSNLLSYVQGLSSASFGLTLTGTTSSGVLRDRTYNGFEFKEAGQAIEELAALDTGFEFRSAAAWSGSTPTRNIVVGYPTLGQPVAGSLIWSYPKGGIINWSYPEDASPGKSASIVYALGAGQGASMLQAQAPTGTPPFPRMAAVTSHKDVSVQATLQGHANAEQTALVNPVTIPQFKVLGRVEPLFGTYFPGDRARYVFAPSIDPRFWTGLDITRRIIGLQVAVRDDGNDEVVHILGPN